MFELNIALRDHLVGVAKDLIGPIEDREDVDPEYIRAMEELITYSTHVWDGGLDLDDARAEIGRALRQD